MKKILTWILTIVGFLVGLSTLFYLIAEPKVKKEDIVIQTNVYIHSVETWIGYDVNGSIYNIKKLTVNVNYYSESGEVIMRRAVNLYKYQNVASLSYNLDTFHETPVKTEVESISVELYTERSIIVMVISFVVGLVGLWKIVFAPLKEKWY